MRTRFPLAMAALLAVAACSETSPTSPADGSPESGPSAALVDSGSPDALVGGFWFLPPLSKQVTTEGEFDGSLDPTMTVCELSGNPLEGPATCVGDPVLTYGPELVTVVPESNYQFSWDTDDGGLNPDLFYRVGISVNGTDAGYLDVNPQNPAPDTPGEDFEGLYAFRLGETIPVKFFISLQIRCDLADQQAEEYVIQCIAQGVIDQNGGIVTLAEYTDEGGKLHTTISTVVQANSLPGVEQVILTMERIDPAAFFAETGETCIPGWDAPLYADCLRISTDPDLNDPLLEDAFIEMCAVITEEDFPGLKGFPYNDEEQDTRIQIIRFSDDSDAYIQGLAMSERVTSSCNTTVGSAAGFFPVPQEEGFLRTAALTANRAAGFFAPQPLVAHGSLNLSGSTSVFSRFQWSLPGQLLAESDDSVVIQLQQGATAGSTDPNDYEQEDGTVGLDVPVVVQVVDAGTEDQPDFPGGLDPSSIEGARVWFSPRDATDPDTVRTDDGGNASTTWTVDPNAGSTQTFPASGLGLLDMPVPAHSVYYPGLTGTYVENSIPFKVTIVGGAASGEQSPLGPGLGDYSPGDEIQGLVVTVLDANGNPVVGYEVTIEQLCAVDTSLCDGSVEFTGATPGFTDEEGKVYLNWTISSFVGSNTLIVKVDGTQVALWTAEGGCTVEVNGQIGDGEWDCATGTETFLANISGGDAPAYVQWQNDGTNLYLLVAVQQSSLDKVNSLRFDFDNTGNGVSGDDDIIGFEYSGVTGPSAADAYDWYLTDRCVNRSQSSCGAADTSDGGSKDVNGALNNDGTYTVYEMSHPLNSGDARDFSLSSGDEIGFFLTLSIGKGAQGNTQKPAFRDYSWKIQIN